MSWWPLGVSGVARVTVHTQYVKAVNVLRMALVVPLASLTRERCQNSFVPPTAVSPTRPVPLFPPGPPTISLPSVAPSNTRTSGSVTQLPLHSLSATHLSGPSPSRGEDQVGGAVVPPSCEATPNRPSVPDLPPYSPLQSPGDFTWGDLDAASSQSVMAAYNEVLHWRKNFFPVLYGSVGKRFVSEMSRLYRVHLLWRVLL